MMTFEQAATYGGGLLVVGIGGWAIRTLYSTARLVDKIEVRVAAHDDQHETHETRGIDHEKRISRIEGCRDALPRPG